MNEQKKSKESGPLKVDHVVGTTVYSSFSEMFKDISGKLEKRHNIIHAKLKKKLADDNRRKRRRD